MEVVEREARFGQFLVERSLLGPHLLGQAQAVSLETRSSLVRALVKLGFMPETALANALAEFEELPRYATSGKLSVEQGELSTPYLKANDLALVAFEDTQMIVATSNPLDRRGLAGLEFASRLKVSAQVATVSEIDAVHTEHETLSVPVNTAEPHAEGMEALKDLASDAPAIRAVQRLITLAVDRKASDIHFEPSGNTLKVRYRLDGVLQDIETLPAAYVNAVVSRVKVMSQLNIAERRLPQDGRLQVTVNGKAIDFRVATSPTLHGESLVLRILDRQQVELDFSRLGFDEHLTEVLRAALAKPYGIILSTGPTGSGKTTTLYTALKELNQPERKILTVEDPIEYALQGVNQTQVKPQIGYTFASALRAFLRQDPDILMVGEIRDRETAETAIQAALTGHLLLSTLHTNTASAAITRLLDMGVDDFLLTSTLNLIIGQRLVRRLCAGCRESKPMDEETYAKFYGDLRQDGPWLVYGARGCEACAGTGYAGRTGLLELLELSEPIRRAVLNRSDAASIEKIATERGMRTMLQHGLELAAQGVTTLEEVFRVTRTAE